MQIILTVTFRKMEENKSPFSLIKIILRSIIKIWTVDSENAGESGRYVYLPTTDSE